MKTMCVAGAIALLALFATPTSAQNLLVNGDFSTNDETGWTRWSSGDPAMNPTPWGGGFAWDASTGVGVLQTTTGSFGWYQAITTVPGRQYTITAQFSGNGDLNWVECLFFNDDGRAIYAQLDAPLDSSIIAKVDGWGLNGGMPFDPISITEKYFPSGPLSNVITATGTTMYVGLKAGSGGSGTYATFDDVTVTPEPTVIVLLGLSLFFLLRRRVWAHLV
jgi:hypothetical protein